MLPASRKTATLVAGALLSLWLVGQLASDALMDASAVHQTSADLLRFRAFIDAGALDSAAPELRKAIADAEPVLDGWWPRHAWTRLFRGEERSALRATLDASVRDLEQAIEARASRIADLRLMREAADYASTLAELDAIETRRRGHGPRLATDAPAAHDALVAAIASRRDSFASDVSRNREALAAVEARRARAAGDASALLSVLDAVLPAPDRGDEGARLASVKASAAAERSAILAATRLAASAGAAANAHTSAEARALLAGLDADPDLRRSNDPALEARVRETRSSIGDRIARLAAWEAGMAAVDRALSSGEPAAAQRALRRLAPCDPRTEAIAKAARSSFPARFIESAVQGAIAAVERGDHRALQRIADATDPGSTLAAGFDDAERAQALRPNRQVRRRIDQALYEQFRRRPCDETANRYLEGWPGVPRAMAATVRAWRDRARTGGTTLALVGARWQGTGANATRGTLEDRPDAKVTVRAGTGEEFVAVFEDVVAGETRSLEGPMLTTDAAPGTDVEVTVSARIDLRDAMVADPAPVGDCRQTAGAWRAQRVTEVPLLDPLWGSRPHALFLRAVVPGAPPLPPYPRP